MFDVFDTDGNGFLEEGDFEALAARCSPATAG
ncbi:hypothetical protein [Streptomyces tendae]